MIWFYIFIGLLVIFILIVLIKNLIIIPLLYKYKKISKDFYSNFQLNSLTYYDFPKWENWFKSHERSIKKKNKRRLKLFLTKSKKGTINEFNKIINRIIIDIYNNFFVERKIEEHQNFLNQIQSYPFDKNQLTSILHDEINNLVIAGAGTGKTSTIVGKVSYLTKIQKLNENKILLLAFTNKAVEEMQLRLESISLGNLNIRTFHSLGYEILSKSTNFKKEIAFSEESKEKYFDFIEKTIKALLIEDIDFLKNVNKYFKSLVSDKN